MISKLRGLMGAGAKALEEGTRQLEDVSLRMNHAAHDLAKQAKYEAAAGIAIKTAGFTDDIERNVMLKAASKERARRARLLARLDSDSSGSLSKFFAEALQELRDACPDKARLYTIEGNAGIEETALKFAELRAETKRMLDADPAYRALYEESLRELGETGEK